MGTEIDRGSGVWSRANHDHCPTALIFCESQFLLQMQLEIWESCFILLIYFVFKSNSSTEKGGKCLLLSATAIYLFSTFSCVARILLREVAYLIDSLICPIMWR